MLKIQKFTATEHKVKALIYGASGTGKTWFSATAPKPLYLTTELGFLGLDGIDYVKITSIEDIRTAYKELKSGNYQYDTIIIDSLSDIGMLYKKEYEEKSGKKISQAEWFGYYETIRPLLHSFRELPIHVIMICGQLIEKDRTGNIVLVKPNLNGKLINECMHYFDFVACMVGKGDIRVSGEKILTKNRGDTLDAKAPADFKERISLAHTLSANKDESGMKK